jgi:hypothetical protein
MATLIVLENNCGDYGQQYKDWLTKNLPDDIELDFREGASGVGGGLYDEEDNIIEGGGNCWWDKFCSECE